MSHSFLEGAAIGLAYAVPIGPIALLCLRRTLTENWLAGLVSGLGSATAIGLYSSIVGLSVNLLADASGVHFTGIRLLGGLFLVYLGIKIALSRAFHEVRGTPKKSYFHYYATTLLLAFGLALPDPTFPAFVLNQTAHLEAEQNYSPANFAAGVAISEALWWLFFCSTCWNLRRFLKPKFLQWINYASGSAIACCGLLTTATLLLSTQQVS